MKRKVKKFGRGGDILTGLGGALLGYGLYNKFNKDKDEKESKPAPSAENEERKKGIAAPKEEKELSKQGKFPNEPEDGTSGGAPESLADKPIKSTPKKAAPTKTASQTFPLSSDDKPSKSRYEGQTFPTSSSKNEDLPSKPYPSGVKGTEKDPYLTPKTAPSGKAAAQSKAGSMFKTDTAEYDANNARYRKQLEDNRKKSEAEEGRTRAGTKAGSRTDFFKTDTAEYDANNARYRKQLEDAKKDTGKARNRAGQPVNSTFKRGGEVKKYASGGSVSSASRRADGIATKGKTRGKIY